MAGKRQRPPAMLTGHRRAPELRAISAAEREAPPFPATIEKPLTSTRALWEQLWRSPSADVWVLDSDGPQLEHLMWCLDERTRARRAFARKRIMEDSKGRLTLNPLGSHLARLDRTIAQLVERLGLTPLDRLRLGLTVLDARTKLRDLNDDLDDDPEDRDDEPRVIDLDDVG